MDDIFKKIRYTFDSNPFKSNKWVTVVIVFIDGRVIEKPYIENPWGFIQSLKSNSRVKTAYIKKDASDVDPFKK